MFSHAFHNIDLVPALMFSIGFLISVIMIWSY
jgi:hypothetical protein